MGEKGENTARLEQLGWNTEGEVETVRISNGSPCPNCPALPGPAPRDFFPKFTTPEISTILVKTYTSSPTVMIECPPYRYSLLSPSTTSLTICISPAPPSFIDTHPKLDTPNNFARRPNYGLFVFMCVPGFVICGEQRGGGDEQNKTTATFCSTSILLSNCCCPQASVRHRRESPNQSSIFLCFYLPFIRGGQVGGGSAPSFVSGRRRTEQLEPNGRRTVFCKLVFWPFGIRLLFSFKLSECSFLVTFVRWL